MDEADGRAFIGVLPVLAGVVEVEVHLAGVGVGEGAELEINDDEAAQAAVEEEEVHAIPDIADAEAALASDEGEVAAEFEQEVFEMADERVFEVGLGVFVLEIQEFEHERIAHGFVHGEGVAGLGLLAFAEHGGFVLGKERALVKEGTDLAVELADAPAAAEGFGVVKIKSLGRARTRDERNIMGPRQR